MDQLQPVRPVTVFQAVLDQLSTLLAGETYAPGDPLPSERELAAQLQVSRPSVREALKALHGLGSVTVRGRSAYVKSAPVNPQAVVAGSATTADLLEIHEFREAIESHIAALAAERAAPQAAEALEQVLTTMEQAFSRDVEAFLVADRQFRRTLAEAAGNRLLLARPRQMILYT